MSFWRWLWSHEWEIAPTICGWTPGLRGIVGGRLLACGCLVGDYLSTRGHVIRIVDHAAPGCRDGRHGVNCIIDNADQPTAFQVERGLTF